LAHRKPLVSGAAIDVDIVRRCVDAPQVQCKVDSDCATGTCRSTCDCDDPSSSNCEIAGPSGGSRCLRSQKHCSIDADCGAADRCVRFFGPPLPLSAANTPACVTTFFATDLVGTYDTKTGHGSSSTFLRSRVHLGIAQDLPCPRCGRLDDDPQIGDEFICEDGPNDGKPCTVDAVSEIFGGVSSQCPPAVEDNVSGQGLAVIFRDLTTDEASVMAAIPCVAPNLCTDDGSACSTNADCKRCVGTGAPCSSPADCGGGRCAEAPDPEQPITCGFWCHCGFCEDDPSRPCTSNAECDEGEHCNPGDSSSGIQERPNGCSDLVCGRAEREECCAQGEPGCGSPTPLVGECSEKRWVTCTSNVDCAVQNGGECLALKRPCFGSVIERTGTASAIGNHCIDDPDVSECATNADSNVGSCVADTAEPTFVGLFCVPKTASGGINAAGGIPGPGAISFHSTILFCRCGDGEIGCNEECDDGNNDIGDGCDQACRNEASALPASSPASELPTRVPSS
jgi:cysteine-rich repeat protein